MGLFNDKQIPQTHGAIGSKGAKGDPGVGFKLTSSGDYDMDKKKIFNLETQDDVAVDADYNSYAKDLRSAANKEYLNEHFLKKNRDETFFDCVGRSLQNTEPYYDGLYNNTSIPNVEYVKLEDNKVKTELNNKLADKADLSTSAEQTFNSIINVPDFIPENNNLSNVMNKHYIDDRDKTKADKTYVDDNFLSKKTGGTMDNAIEFNNLKPENQRQINDLGHLRYNSSATSKSYVDSVVQYMLEDDEVMALDGRNPMEANLDMGGYNITNLKNPSNDTDAVNKKYLEDHVGESHVQSVNNENKFKYIMDDPAAQVTEEDDDVKLGNVVIFQNSPHQVNKNVVDMKLTLDSSDGYYSSRIGLNLYVLPNDEYTVCFELMWVSNKIDPNSLQINGISSIETIHNVSIKTFNTQKYARLICQFTKSQNIGHNYLYIDVTMKNKTGISYDQTLQTYFTVYGISGHQPNINPSLYDQIYYVANDQIVFNAPINMNTQAIYGIEEGTTDDQAVNFKQLYSYNNATKITLGTKITTIETKLTPIITQIPSLQPKSYYNEVFEYFFDLLDPNSFDMDDTYGSNIKSVGGKLILNNTISLDDFDPKNGLIIRNSNIHLDNALGINPDYTIFVSFLHDNSLTGQDYVIGAGVAGLETIVIKEPYVAIKSNKFSVTESWGQITIEEDILSAYQNKHLFLWFCKKSSNYKAIICQGGHINRIEKNPWPNSIRGSIVINLPYKIQRIDFSTTFHDIYKEAFHKISFLEKANGVYFI